MEIKYLVLERSTFKIIDDAKVYCKRIRKYAYDGEFAVFYLSSIQSTKVIAKINEVNKTNY